MSEDWLVRPVEGEVPIQEQGDSTRLIQEHPLHPYTQCTHPALGDSNSEYLKGWRVGRAASYWSRQKDVDFVAENCSHAARVRVAGQPMCRRHAGMVLLAMCEDMLI